MKCVGSKCCSVIDPRWPRGFDPWSASWTRQRRSPAGRRHSPATHSGSWLRRGRPTPGCRGNCWNNICRQSTNTCKKHTVPLLLQQWSKTHIFTSLFNEQTEGDSDHPSDSGQPEAGPKCGWRGWRSATATGGNHNQSMRPTLKADVAICWHGTFLSVCQYCLTPAGGDFYSPIRRKHSSAGLLLRKRRKRFVVSVWV